MCSEAEDAGGLTPAKDDSEAARHFIPRTLPILVCVDYKSGTLKVFSNIEIMFIPPYTPEMNPIEQIWRELRARGFHNEVFQTLAKVVDRLCGTICNLTAETIRSITCREWILSCFN